MNPWPVISSSLRQRPWTAVIVVLLIAASVALGVAVSAQDRALRRGSARAANDFDLVIGAPGSETQLVLTSVFLQVAAVPLVEGRVLQALQVDPRVSAVAPLGFGDFYKGHPVIGTTAAMASRFGALAVAEGRMFAAIGEVVAGADVPLPVGHEFHPSHGHAAHADHDGDDDDDHDVHDGDTYRVTGRMARTGTPWDRALVGPVEMVWETHALSTGHTAEGVVGPPWNAADVPGVPAIVVKPRTVADAYSLRNQYRRGGTMAVFPGEVLVSLYALMGDARVLLSLIAIGTQILVAAAVLLAVLLTVAQRRRQVAILRALGASRAYIFAAVWGETALLIAVGAVLGLGGGIGSTALLSLAVHARTGLDLPVAVGGTEVLMAVSLVAAGSLMSLVPGWIACRAPVAAGLRG